MSTLPVVGKYQLIRKLATGGMAEVFLAKTAGAHGFEKTVVLKRILPHLAEDESFVHMFLSEAKLAAQLNHPNVVTVFDFGEEGGTSFLVMEYIDGPNLRALFKRANELQAPIPFGQVAKIISFACEGLAFAHEFVDPETGEPMSLVHRDISPDNILLARNGAVKVVDFGIAKASNQTHHTRTGTIKGKFAYMPPEQLKGLPLDRRADIFALGIVLHELIAGVKPFDVASDATIMQAILCEKMRPASMARADTPAALQAIIDRALEKDRESRYPDCRAMQADLEKFIFSTGEPVGPHQLAQLVSHLAAASGGAAAPRTPSQPALPAVATNPGAAAVSASQVIEVDLPSTGVVPAPVPPSAAPPAPPRPQLEVVPEPSHPGEVQIRSAAELSIPPVEPPRSRAWVYVLAVGLVLLGAGGTLVATKVLGGGGTRVAPAEPPAPASAERGEPAPPAPAPPPSAPPAEAPPPEVLAKAEPPPAAAPVPPPMSKRALKGPAKLDRRGHGAAPPQVAEPAPAPAAAPAPAPKPTVTENGTIAFRIRPFATVLVDGKYLGDTPIDPITLPVGQVMVTLINKELGKELKVPFEVKAGANVFKYNLAE